MGHIIKMRKETLKLVILLLPNMNYLRREISHKVNQMKNKIKQKEKQLHALTRACRLLERQTVNMYTDSQYAVGVIYDVGML